VDVLPYLRRVQRWFRPAGLLSFRYRFADFHEDRNMMRTALIAALLVGLSATAMATDRGTSGYVAVDNRGHGHYRGDFKGNRYGYKRDHYRFGDRYRGERWDRGYRGPGYGYRPGHRHYGPRYSGPRYYGRGYHYGPPRYYGRPSYYGRYRGGYGYSVCGYDRSGFSFCYSPRRY
jgi:hypothetical protein